MHFTPAQYVTKMFGGIRATARAIGRDPSSVLQWGKPVEIGGRGGMIPTAIRLTILAKAKELDLDITSQDLDYGREIPETHGAEAG